MGPMVRGCLLLVLVSGCRDSVRESVMPDFADSGTASDSGEAEPFVPITGGHWQVVWTYSISMKGAGGYVNCTEEADLVVLGAGPEGCESCEFTVSLETSERSSDCAMYEDAVSEGQAVHFGLNRETGKIYQYYEGSGRFFDMNDGDWDGDWDLTWEENQVTMELVVYDNWETHEEWIYQLRW